MIPSAARRKAKGSPEPVGRLIIGKKRNERVNFVGKRDDDTFRYGWTNIVRTERLIVVGDSVSDAWMLSVV